MDMNTYNGGKSVSEIRIMKLTPLLDCKSRLEIREMLYHQKWWKIRVLLPGEKLSVCDCSILFLKSSNLF